MEVTALCMRLWMDMLVMLLVRVDHSYFAQKANAAFPRVLPDRLQFFEYENVSVICQELGGLTEWRVMRRLNNRNPTDSYTWQSSAPSCTIHLTFSHHSGEYWCEDAEGNTHNAVIITINPGSVILEVPASPVMEGDNVSLYCRKKDTQSNHMADFYKDGSTLGTWYSNMTIQNVSKSDEGLYKCSISGAGESPQSWLTVLKVKGDEGMFNNSIPAADEESRPSSHPPNLPSLLWIVVLVALMLLVMGLLLCRKHRVLGCLLSGKPTTGSHSPADPADSRVDSIADPHHATYAVVKKQRREKVSDGDNAGDPDLMTYAVVKKQSKKKEPDRSGAASKRRLTDESVVYSTVNSVVYSTVNRLYNSALQACDSLFPPNQTTPGKAKTRIDLTSITGTVTEKDASPLALSLYMSPMSQHSGDAQTSHVEAFISLGHCRDGHLPRGDLSFRKMLARRLEELL
ncbi:uncharacterized protein LOC116052133 [Sander lucioperca]|uniref:uncharacterized protein LOC116052133 n=1 Tax=Sander lucioperca TaxID=283035 RepID=UPI001653D3F7|nr:uncharacterized protein LOC116052133 [Sander lucioperca]